MSDITTRLRQTRADMLGTDDEQHYFDCHEAAGEIERLRQWGRLTDEEWDALYHGAASLRLEATRRSRRYQKRFMAMADTLQRLRERLGGR
jgi:hypothetical protein